MNKFRFLPVLLLVLPVQQLQALPDDREKEIRFSAHSSELFMDEGIAIYYGEPDEPATITQGSMRISGQEITVERIDGELGKITAVGSPARFQQQPAVDKAIIHGSAQTVVYDSSGQRLTLEENAELLQDNNRLQGYQVHYDMNAGRANAVSRNSDDRINMTIQPDAAE